MIRRPQRSTLDRSSAASDVYKRQGLIGIVIAMVVNMFMKSDTMGYVISVLSVIIFTGLTAYDMQRLKNLGGTMISGTEVAQKMALMGALSLYLDFLNLFLSLLRLFGDRK